MKLRDIASALGCEVIGDGEIEITGVAGMERAAPGELTFLANPKYAHKVKDTRAAAILSAGPGDEPVEATSTSRVLLCQTPGDIVAMRRDAPATAREWRYALRRALAGSMARGYRILGATRSGWYVLESGTA